jgi:hypothetical protein
MNYAQLKSRTVSGSGDTFTLSLPTDAQFIINGLGRFNISLLLWESLESWQDLACCLKAFQLKIHTLE